MEDGDDANSHHPSRQSRFVELKSPLKSQAGIGGTNQGGHTKERPQAPPGPGDQGSKVKESIETIKSHSNLFESIADSRKRKANTEVYNSFISHPKKRDPSHVKLMKTGWAMAKRVFHPPESERWPTAEANAFMKKYLTLVPEQKMELEGDFYQEAFLKEHEKNPSYKQAFDFKTKMFAL